MATAQEPETRALLRAYHVEGDLQARDRLIELHLPLVRALARRYAGRSEQLDDLVQVGSIGLIKAIDRFDMERGVELTTYAIPTIIGELKRHFRDKGWAVHVPRRLKELSLQLTQLVEDAVGEARTVSDGDELAKAAKVDEEDVIEALEIGQAYSTLSLSRPGTRTPTSIRSARSAISIRATRRARTGHCSCRASSALDERERKIMTLRFFGGLTQSEIAARGRNLADARVSADQALAGEDAGRRSGNSGPPSHDDEAT